MEMDNRANQDINCNMFGIVLASLSKAAGDIFKYDVPQEHSKDSQMSGGLIESGTCHRE